MTLAFPQRAWLTVPAVVGAAAIYGALIAQAPQVAVGLLGLVGVVTLAFAAPVAHLLILIGLTALVPFGIQNQYGIGGGAGSAGLLLSDVFLFAGLARAAWVLLSNPPRRTLLLGALGVTAFIAFASLQFLRGIEIGREPSVVGAELRVLLGFGTALLAIPLLRDPDQRRRLFAGLAVLGILLGLWGIAQWTLSISFAAAEDAGLREGISYTTGGKGQIQGGLYAFAPAIVITFAVFTSGVVQSVRGRALLIAVMGLNALGLLFTYERTFWVATIIGLAFVILRTSGRQRIKALVATPIVLTLFLAVLATAAPDTLGAARERLLSIGQYGTDNSLRYRVVESQHVIGQVRQHPIVGNGLGASIFWGRPWEQVKPESNEYAHNGYLWLVWKLGLPIALILLALLLAAVVRRPPNGGDPMLRAFTVGASSALLVLLLASVTFPSFSALAITPTMGLFIAIALAGQALGSGRAGGLALWRGHRARPG